MNIRLEAEPRSDFGKGAARRLRRSGRIPVVLYGDGTELLHLSLAGHALEQALRAMSLRDGPEAMLALTRPLTR